MTKQRRHVGEDALVLMAAAKCHTLLGIGWVPSALCSHAYFDNGTRSFVCVLVGPVDLTLTHLEMPPRQASVAVYQVAMVLGEGEDPELYYAVQPLEVPPLAGGLPVTFDGIEILDCLWHEAAVDENLVEPLHAARAN